MSTCPTCSYCGAPFEKWVDDEEIETVYKHRCLKAAETYRLMGLGRVAEILCPQLEDETPEHWLNRFLAELEVPR
jgi:hypothetical protein